jgi:hypothetical protein
MDTIKKGTVIDGDQLTPSDIFRPGDVALDTQRRRLQVWPGGERMSDDLAKKTGVPRPARKPYP